MTGRLVWLSTLPFSDYFLSSIQSGYWVFYQKIYASMSMQSNRLISGYPGLIPTPWSPVDGIFYAMPSFIKLMTGLTMTLPTALLQKPLLKPLLSSEEIDALLYGIFPTAECSSDLVMAVSAEKMGEFHTDISLEKTCHKVPLLALACLN